MGDDEVRFALTAIRNAANELHDGGLDDAADTLEAELGRLVDWKESALTVLAEWDDVWVARQFIADLHALADTPPTVPLTQQELRALALLLVERHVRLDFPICDVLAWENTPELSEADHRRLGDAAVWVADRLAALRRRYERHHDIDAHLLWERVS